LKLFPIEVKMKIPFNPNLALKILLLYLIINLALLPVLALLYSDLYWFYSLIIPFEGFFSLVFGCIQIFNSLFSTIEVEDHRYIGNGFYRHQLKSVDLTAKQKKAMRIKGTTMVIMGLILILSVTIWNVIFDVLF